MAEVTKYTLTLGTVTNKGKKCKTPKVEILSTGDFSIACIDDGKGVYQLEGFLPEDKCIDFLISCGECSECSPKEIRKCVCDDENECGSCETCGDDGFCVSRCTEDTYCFEETCVECDPNTPCPNGKVCKKGRCVCPQDKPFLVGGKCLECIEDAPCKECLNGSYIDKDCIGVCDPSVDECVDCLTTSDCDGINECCVGKSCDCCTGFVRDVNGFCVEAPECDENTPCGPCRTCIDGNCEQIVCPDGKICLGEKGCVEECDCNTPTPCSKNTQTCIPSDEGCGCIDCFGDCATGCSDGCYCNGSVCVGDECFGGKCPCNNGADCPDGYGCDGNNCVPCASLDCTNGECANILGCGCANGNCVDSDIACGNTPCTTSSDCGIGCGCDGGVCKSCDNYSCLECGQINGCGCTNGNCEGGDAGCTDTFTLEKGDEECNLTATLNKNEDCACPPLTVDVKTKRVMTTDGYTLGFLGEVRKGIYEGSLNTPLLDNITSPDIVENDSPTSGRITVSSVAKYREYTVDPVTSVRSNPVIVTEPAEVVEGSFVTGTVATIDMGSISYKTLGTTIVTERDAQNRITKEISYFRVDITATITDDFNFPNTCTYKDGDVIGKYRITSNNDFEAFGLAFGSHLATTITSGDSRLPIFRWYKSSGEAITTPPFRKLYVEKTDNSYIDVITKEEGVEHCKYYKVVTDCTCTTSPDLYAVFCNPEDIEYDIKKCNLEFTLKGFSTCDVNEDSLFYIRAGSIYTEFLPANAPINQPLTSTEQISEVEFGQVCDVRNLCTKTYSVPAPYGGDLVANFNTQCSASDLVADVFIPPTDTTGGCGVVAVTVGGVRYFPNNSAQIPAGIYEATVEWACGCFPTTQQLEINCCGVEVPSISRDCQGISTCAVLPTAQYTINGTAVSSGDVCATVAALSKSEGATIVVDYGGCESRYITLEPIEADCCSGFGSVVTVSGDTATIRVLNDNDATIIVTPQNASVTTPTLTNTGGGVYTAFPITAGASYNLTLVSSKDCATLAEVFTSELSAQCSSDVVLETVSSANGICILDANTDTTLCPCQQGSWDVAISNIEDVDDDTFSLTYSAITPDFDADELTSSGTIVDAAGSVNTSINASGSGVIVVDKVFSSGASVQSQANAVLTVQDFGNSRRLIVNLSNIPTNAPVSSVVVTPQGVAPITKTSAFSSTYLFDNIQASFPLQVDVVFNYFGSPSQVFTYTVPTGDGGTYAFTSTLEYNTRVEQWANIKASLISLTLEDGCRYGNVDHTFKVKSNGDIFSGTNSIELSLAPLTPVERKKYFEWTKDGQDVFDEYQLQTSVLPTPLLEQGSVYTVTTTCGDCVSTDSRTLCCPIVVVAEGDPCEEQLHVSVTGIEGVYSVVVDGVVQTVTISQTGQTAGTTFDLPKGSYTGYVEPFGAANCREAFAGVVYGDATALVDFGPETFTLTTFLSDAPSDVQYCLLAGTTTVATFTTATAPVGNTYANPGNLVVTLVSDCGDFTTCEQYFTPSPQSCLGTSIQVTVDYSGTTPSVTFPTTTSNPTCDVVEVLVTGNGINQTYAAGSTTTLVAGTYNYSATLDCACPNATGSFLVKEGSGPTPLAPLNTFDKVVSTSPCGNTAEVEQTEVGGQPTLLGSLSETACDCEGNIMEAKIVGVAESGNDIIIDIESQMLDGQYQTQPELGIASGFIDFEVDGGTTQSIGVGSASVTIPKVLTQTTQRAWAKLTIPFDNSGSTQLVSATIEPSVLNSPNLQDQDIVSGTLVITTGGTSSQVPFSLDATYSTTFTLNIPVVSDSFSYELRFSDSLGNLYQQAVPVTVSTVNRSGIVAQVNTAYTTVQESYQTIRMNVRQIVGLDGCTYEDVTIGDWTLNSGGFPQFDGNFGDLIPTNNLTEPSILATWENTSGVVYQEFASSGVSTLPPANVVVGDTYTLTGSCGGCTADVSSLLCPEISMTAELSLCQDSVTLEMNLPNGIPYTVEFEGVVLSASQPISGNAVLIFPGQLQDNTTYQVRIFPQASVNCEQIFELTTGVKDIVCS